jgi:hypothetical protein
MDEICSGRAKVCCDRWIRERVWELTLESFGLREFGELSEFIVREVKPRSPEVPKLTLGLRSEDAREPSRPSDL